MTQEKAIEFLQEHLDNLEAEPEELAKWGDCIVAITDHVTLLERALVDKTRHELE